MNVGEAEGLDENWLQFSTENYCVDISKYFAYFQIFTIVYCFKCTWLPNLRHRKLSVL